MFPGTVKFFGEDLRDAQGEHLKVPHMGWNQVRHVHKDHPIWKDIDDMARFYFVHSYYAETGPYTTATTDYIVPFSAAVQKDNFHATEFHPEKSGKVGAQILTNFLNL